MQSQGEAHHSLSLNVIDNVTSRVQVHTHMTQPASAAGLRFVLMHMHTERLPLGSLGRSLPPITPLGKGKIKNQTYSIARAQLV